MLKLNNISFDKDGCKINYDFTTSTAVSKYFEHDQPFYIQYAEDVSHIPRSIAIIPFLANTITIAWFANFDVEVDEVDEDFAESLEKIKAIFQTWYPNKKLGGRIVAKKLVKNSIRGTKKAMLFSGGVDAFATYIRNYEDVPELVTIHGPDIAISDTKQWNELTSFLDTEPLLSSNFKNYIETNVRDFYTYHVQLLVDDMGWWGKIQHGISLLGSAAPLSLVRGFNRLVIASSYTKEVDVSWGSTPEADELLKWGNIQIIHDGYELRRQDKVDLIANFGASNDTNFRLRVCYSERRTEFNCSSCEKCFRTILGLVLAGENPNKYGFDVNSGFYDRIYKVLNIGGASKGMRYFWWELMEKAKIAESPFIFENHEIEKNKIKEIAEGKIDNLLDQKMQKSNKSIDKIKFLIRNKLSTPYAIYRKIRGK